MQILVDNGCYRLHNLGDMAMLDVAVARLRQLWPGAVIHVMTYSPDRLRRLRPDVRPVSARGPRLWRQNLVPLVHRVLPRAASRRVAAYEEKIRHRWPSPAQSWIEFKLKRRGIEAADMRSFVEAVRGADLVVASGGGYITDSFQEHATRVLETLQMAAECGAPTAMFSQGLGPLRHPALRARAKAVLPLVDLIALREHRAGGPLLESLGVAPDRVMTTGDDSLELAHGRRLPKSGTGIGINLRVAQSSQIDGEFVGLIRQVLHDAATTYQAPLVPVPISLSEASSDVRTIQRLLAGSPGCSNGGAFPDSPQNVIEQVSQCRVVVTGSYHAGVFALAQGIPVVGLARSEYYRDKFLGLADQFGAGCDVIIAGANLRERVRSAIAAAWDSADRVRPRLLEAAAQQIELGRVAYRRLYDLVESRKAKT